MAHKNKKTPVEKSAPTKKRAAVQHLGMIDFWRRHVPEALVIVLASVALYISTVSYDYVLDDKIVITDNVYTNKGFAGIKDILSHESFEGYFQKRMDLVAGARYRPLSIVTFAIERQFFESPKSDEWGNPQNDARGVRLQTGNPAISHFINVLMYALTCLLLYHILVLLFPRSLERPWYLGIPFIATMLFVVHPLHIEVVANIKGRDEIMTLGFSLLTLYYSIQFVDREQFGSLIMSGIMLLLGLLSKENAITFVAIIPLTLYTFRSVTRQQLIRVSTPLLITTVFYLMIRYQVIGYFLSGKEITDLMNNPFYGMSFVQKYSTIMYTLGLYLKLSFFPHPLTHDYYPYAIPIMELSDIRTLLSIGAYVLLSVIALWGLVRKNVISYSIWFYLIALSIVSNLLIPIGSFMNERFLYFSSIGFALALAYIVVDLLPSKIPTHESTVRFAGVGILALMLVGFSAKTVDRVPALRNTASLNEADIETSKASCETNCFMGVDYFQRYLRAKADPTKTVPQRMALLDTAETYLNTSMRINPEYHAAHQMMSGVYTEQFTMDNDIQRLLNGLAAMSDIKDKVDYIDQYCQYLNRTHRYDSLLPAFYHKVGYEMYYKKRADKDRARTYIQMGLEVDPNNQLLKNDLQEVGGAAPKL